MQYTGYRQCIFISSTGGFVFFHKCLLCIKIFIPYGFMPKIIFFYAEKLRAIYWCVVFICLSQMHYRTFIGHPRN